MWPLTTSTHRVTTSMLFLYNFFSFFALLALLPVLPFIAAKRKYRDRILQRLGIGVLSQLPPRPDHPAITTIWIHALSVGEVTSALPLVQGIRRHFPESRIIFSVSTRSGDLVAKRLIAPYADAIIASPFDFWLSVRLVLHKLRPDLFILVETDFWPNWLHQLARKRIPLLLVNGRISASSFATYHRYRCFFRPMFQTFTLLSMQTATDADKMQQLGIAPKRILPLGNLKFDAIPPADARMTSETARRKGKKIYGFAADSPLWICGSTHRGEEQAILPLFAKLRAVFPDLQLLIAPRRIERADEIATIARDLGLPCRTRTHGCYLDGPLLILDTIGELAGCYPLAEIVFIGGSLVPEGGHNPLEPAACGVPVLFGPHMEDFIEIATELVASAGALYVDNAGKLHHELKKILADEHLRQTMGTAARDCVTANRGVVDKHLAILSSLLVQSEKTAS